MAYPPAKRTVAIDADTAEELNAIMEGLNSNFNVAATPKTVVRELVHLLSTRGIRMGKVKYGPFPVAKKEGNGKPFGS